MRGDYLLLMNNDLYTLTLVLTPSMNKDLERAAAMSGRTVLVSSNC
jgi:hypothetical protein